MTATDPDRIAAEFEAGLDADRRRATGAHFTPQSLAARLAAIALDGMPMRALVCDPACGAGGLLVAAGRALVAAGVPAAEVARDLLWGVDSDGEAVAAARRAVRAWAGVDPGEHLVVGDGLRAGEWWPSRFDVVLGNPPFLNQLERATVRAAPVPDALAGVVRPYTDTAWLFLAAAPQLVRPGGRVVLVQPQSVAAARDAGPVRASVSSSAVLEGMWSCADPVFDASVRVCAPVLSVGGSTSGVVRRWTGRDVASAAGAPVPASDTSSWAGLLVVADAPPPVRFDAAAGTLGDLATATAGFREQFYGLAPFVVDRAGREGAAPLVTTAHIDVARIAWGERPVRFAGRRWQAPQVDLDALARNGAPNLVRWVAARRVPKVLLATQTRVLEAGVDAGGGMVPSTPVISVEGAADQWLVAAALTAPPVSAWALAEHGGTALSAGAIKLAARQVLAVPLPRDGRLWALGTDRLRAGDVAGAAAALNAAHGASDDVLAWWSRRARQPFSTQ